MKKKKPYIKPEITVIDIEPARMLAASSIEVKPGEEGTEQLSNRYRGSWGDLWDKGETR